MKILDISAGKRAVWYNKNHPMATYIDIRSEVKPDIVMDSRETHKLNQVYDLIVWDPPHLNTGKNSIFAKRYGHFTTAEILDTIKQTGKALALITHSHSLMALKWNDHDIRLQRVFDLLPNWEPLFGHLTKDGPRSQTYWAMLRRV